MLSKIILVIFLMLFFLSYYFLQVNSLNKNTAPDYEKLWSEINGVPDILRDHLFVLNNKEKFINDVKDRMKSTGIDITEVSRSAKKSAEDQKENELRRLQIERFIAFDENFDSVVTKDEVSGFVNEKSNSQEVTEKKIRFGKEWRYFLRFDGDHNGQVTYQEMSVLDMQMKQEMQDFSSMYDKYLELDNDKDEKFYRSDLEKILGNFFDEFDQNKDGIFTEAEVLPYVKARQAYRKIYGGDVQKCEMPKPDGEFDVLVIKVRHGKALSNVTVIGQDKVTEVTRVFIDKAQEDVYLILSSTEAMIWLFEGNTAAVKKVIINSAGHLANERGYSGGGIVGVEREKVTFLHKHCLPVSGGNKNVVSENVRNTIVRLIGREPDLMKDTDDNVKVIQISGGEISVNKAENAGLSENIKRLKGADFHSGTWNEFEMQYPGGVFDFNPQDVISDAGVVRYDILPVMAGVSQLIAGGYLERISDDEFRIIKDLPRFPAGLKHGNRGVKFFVSANTNVSADFKSFCVFQEGTNELLSFDTDCER